MDAAYSTLDTINNPPIVASFLAPQWTNLDGIDCQSKLSWVTFCTFVALCGWLFVPLYKLLSFSGQTLQNKQGEGQEFHDTD